MVDIGPSPVLGHELQAVRLRLQEAIQAHDQRRDGQSSGEESEESELQTDLVEVPDQALQLVVLFHMELLQFLHECIKYM